MLGRYPLAIAPLAVLTGGQIAEADASVTASATVSFDSQTVTVAARLWDSNPSLTSAFVSQAVAAADTATTAALTVSLDSSATASVEFSDTLTGANAFTATSIASSDSSSVLALTESFEANATANADTSVSLAALFGPTGAGLIGADATTSTALSTSLEGVGRLMSSADASAILALSTAFDSAFSTVLGSTWSVIINPQIGPVINPVTIAAPGSGYNTANQLRINGGDNNAVVAVTARTGTGVLSVGIVNAGTNYTPGTYTTTALTGSGSGCQVTIVVSSEFALFRSGATKGSALSSPQTATTAWTSLTFAAATSATTAAITADMVSGATAGSVASTTDSAFADWQGMAIGPALTDLISVLQSNVSWSGEAIRRLIVAQLTGTSSSLAMLRGSPTTIYLRGD